MILTAKQSVALDLLEDQEHTDILFGGGVGGGKSVIGCYWLVKMCVKFPRTRYIMGRAILKRLRETTLNTFFEVCRMQQIIANKHYNFNQHTGIITFYNGSEIILKDLFFYPSDPNFDALGSLEVTGIFVDEASEIVEKAYQVLKSRIRYKLNEYGLIPKIFMTTNPSKNFLYRDFFQKHRGGKLEDHKAFVQSLVIDNPHLSKHYVMNLLSLDEATKERLLNGNWDYDEDPRILCQYNRILDMFTNIHVEANYAKYFRPENRYMTCDVSLYGADQFVIFVWHNFRVINLHVMPKATPEIVESTIRYLCRKHRVPQSNICYDSDGIGQYLRGFLVNAYPFINNATPTKKHSVYREQFKNIKAQCYFELADKINKGEIYISDKIAGKYKDSIIEECSLIKNRSHMTDNKLAVLTKEELRDSLGRSPDFSDAMMMRMVWEVKRARRFVSRANK